VKTKSAINSCDSQIYKERRQIEPELPSADLDTDFDDLYPHMRKRPVPEGYDEDCDVLADDAK
jgi:hypothetical protein